MSGNLSIGACIPCFNAEETLRRAAESVRAQSVEVRELLIVDDGSTDRSPEIGRRVADRCIRLEKNLGRGAARQLAVEQLDDDYILFCDAGLELPSTFVSNALLYFESEKVAAVFGVVIDPNPKSVADRWRNRHLFKAAARTRVSRKASLMTGGALLKRSALIGVGGFDARLAAGEDQELGERLLRAGYDVICDHELRLTPLKRDGVVELLRRYARWNRAPGHALSWREYARSVAYHFSLLRKDVAAADFASAILSLVAPHYLFWSQRSASTTSAPKPVEIKRHSVVKPA